MRDKREGREVLKLYETNGVYYYSISAQIPSHVTQKTTAET